jgi:hypothetical protein
LDVDLKWKGDQVAGSYVCVSNDYLLDLDAEVTHLITKDIYCTVTYPIRFTFRPIHPIAHYHLVIFTSG